MNNQILYNSIAKVEDEYTRKVLYSQFIDKYYPEAFNAIQHFFLKGQLQRAKK